MSTFKRSLTATRLWLLSSVVVLSACESNNGGSAAIDPATLEPAMANFQVEVTNLTYAQPLTPIALVAHNESVELFSIGESASIEIETIAESGDNSLLLSTMADDANVYNTASAGDLTLPGQTSTIEISVEEANLDMAELSLISMLANTNDALTAVRSINLMSIAEGESQSFTGISYDAGTEANTEAADTIPGPAGDGSAPGTDAVRDDLIDTVRLHAGVVTADDGLATSALSEIHRWDNPVIRVQVTRLP